MRRPTVTSLLITLGLSLASTAARAQISIVPSDLRTLENRNTSPISPELLEQGDVFLHLPCSFLAEVGLAQLGDFTGSFVHECSVTPTGGTHVQLTYAADDWLVIVYDIELGCSRDGISLDLRNLDVTGFSPEWARDTEEQINNSLDDMEAAILGAMQVAEAALALKRICPRFIVEDDGTQTAVLDYEDGCITGAETSEWVFGLTLSQSTTLCTNGQWESEPTTAPVSCRPPSIMRFGCTSGQRVYICLGDLRYHLESDTCRVGIDPIDPINPR